MRFGDCGGCVVPAQHHPASPSPHRGEHHPKRSESGARGQSQAGPHTRGRAGPIHVWMVFKADPGEGGDGRGDGEELGRHHSSPRAAGCNEPQCVLAKTVGTSAVTMATLLKRGNYQVSWLSYSQGLSLSPNPSASYPFLRGRFGSGTRVAGVWHHPQP